jgi:hypothetical protein
MSALDNALHPELRADSLAASINLHLGTSALNLQTVQTITDILAVWIALEFADLAHGAPAREGHPWYPEVMSCSP